MTPKTLVAIVKQTGKDYGEDKVARLSAALAYYTVFSLAPLLMLAVAVAGLVFGREAARDQLGHQMEALVGAQGGQAIQTVLAHEYFHGGSVLATVIGIAALLFGASGVFGGLQDALDTIWKVAPKPGRGVLGFLRDRFFSFTMVLGVAFLLLVSLVVSAALAAAGAWFAHTLPGGAGLWQAINFVVSLAIITVLFALIFKVVPDVEIAWSDVWVGAAVTAFLFVIGKLAIGIYLGHSSVASPFGAAGSLLVIVVWAYYSAQILLLGAEFTHAYALGVGSRVQPSKNAVPVTDAERAEQGLANPSHA